MFSKTSAPAPRRPESAQGAPADTTAQAARRPATPRAASILGSDLTFEGQISGEGELHVEGAVRGDVNVGRLVVGEKAQIEGTIRGGQIEIRGRVVGNIEGRAVKLYETAHVDGDIVHEQLSIEVGAYFQGRCQQFKRPAAPPVQQPQAQAQSTAKVIDLENKAAQQS